MKKILKVLLATSLIFSLFSCKQPTDDATANKEPTKPNENQEQKEPSENQEQKEPEEILTDYYFLYDNVFENSDSDNTLLPTGFGVYSNLTGDETFTPYKKGGDIEFIRDFYFAENKDLYVLYCSYTEGEGTESTTNFILKYSYEKGNGGKYSQTPIEFMNKTEEGYPWYQSIAVKNNDIYLGYSKFVSSTPDSKIILCDATGDAFNQKYVYDLKGGSPTAIEVGPNDEIYVATFNLADNQNKLLCLKKTDTGITLKFEKAIDPIPNKEGNVSTKERIGDLKYQDGALYAIVTNYSTNGYLGGGLIKITVKENDFELGPLFGYREAEAKYNFYEGTGEIKNELVAYPTISKNSDFFYQPKKFIAVKPKKLIISDEGFCFYGDGENKKIDTCDSVVTVDITDIGLKISDRVILKNFNFSASDNTGGTGFSDMDIFPLQ